MSGGEVASRAGDVRQRRQRDPATSASNPPNKSAAHPRMPNSIVWTAQEDEALRHLVLEYGDKRWSLIADKLRTNKGSKQCRRRWKNCLSLDVKKGSWSEEEDDILQKAHAVHGNRWTLIAKLVGGRTDNAVKNRWAALARRKNANGVKRSKRGKSLSRQQGQPQGTGQSTDLDDVLVETRSGSGGFPKPESSLVMNTPESRNGQGPGKHMNTSAPLKAGPSMGLRMGGLEPTSNYFPSCAPTSLSDGLLLNLPIPGNDTFNMASSEHKNLVAQELQTLNYMNDLASPRALLGELMKRPMGFNRDMSFPSMSNRDEVDSLRCPCFTHSELDMLLTALQTCPP